MTDTTDTPTDPAPTAPATDTPTDTGGDVGATGTTPAFAAGDVVQVESFNPWTGGTSMQTGQVVAYLQDPDTPDRVIVAWFAGLSGPLEVDAVTKYDAPTA